MAVMPMKKLLFNMSLPLMLSLLIQSLYNIVDGIYVSRLSEDALTATSLAYPVQFLMIAISVGTAVGLNALMSRRIGSGDHDGASQIATTGLLLSLGSAAVFSLLGIFAGHSLAAAFTEEPDIALMCEQYMRICAVFCYGIFLETLGQRMLTAVGLTALSMVSLIAGALTNILLDPVLIFGSFGVPAMGIQGAAVATVIGQWVGAAVALLLNRMKNPYIHFLWKGYRFQKEDVLRIYRIGLPTMIMQAIGSLMVAVVNHLLIGVSTAAVAFFGVFYKLQNFIMMPMNGLGQAVLPITAFNYGAGNKQRIDEVRRTAIPSALFFACFGLLLFLFVPERLLALFHAQEEMLQIGIPALRIIGFTFPLAAVTLVNGYFCTGLGNSLINMVSGILRQFLLLVPALALLLFCFGIHAAWFAFWVSEAGAFFYSLQRTQKERSAL